jgi:diguanylate cyclase (GGDEF)-like protein
MLKTPARVPIPPVMVRISTRSAAALAAVAVLASAAAAFAADRLTHSAGAVAGLVAAVALVLCAAAGALIHRAQRRERARAARLVELRDLLEVSGSEAESRQLLLRHVQRLLPTAGSAVLSHLESEGRLEPTFGDKVTETPLRALSVGRLSVDSCLAMRLSRGHARRGGDDTEPELVRCNLCGRLTGDVACEPLRAHGRALGSLLVASEEPLGAADREQLHDAVLQAAPILALQRSVDAAERRAASDPLTTLPNRRAADEALARLSAHAGRTVTSLAAVLVDLDRFRQVNDRFGHERGDAALSMIGRVLAAGVRASDFVARYGGEEFLVLAPDTDRSGAAELAEKLRRDIEMLAMPGVGQITASFGVAALPEDAVDPQLLLRRADRALYSAKALGRNRVQEADPAASAEG